MIKETTELKVRFIILFISFFISTFVLMTNAFLSSEVPEQYQQNMYFGKFYLNSQPQWNFNPYDCYNSKLEIFIILFGYGIFMLMLINICLLIDENKKCDNSKKNINSRKDNKRSDKK